LYLKHLLFEINKNTKLIVVLYEVVYKRSTTFYSIDYDALGNLVEEQISAGIDGLVVLGTTGECPTVTHTEHNEVIRFVIKVAAGRTTIIAGTGSNDTNECIGYSERAAADGADALLLVNPYYNRPTQEGLYQHFWKIAEAVDIPQILYNISGRTGVNIQTDTLVRLAQHERIIGVKEASGDLNQIMEVITQTPDDFIVLSGDDNLTFPLICLGGHGVVSVLSNIMPAEIKAMVDAARLGDVSAARQLHYRLLPLMQGCFTETNPIPIKTALALQGKMQEVFRLPMCPMQSENREKWQTLLQSNNLI
jgi:4-hydroxy-tetrahydrodipicolinate synthase